MSDILSLLDEFDKHHRYDHILAKGPEAAFELLEAQEWIDDFRVATGNRLDIDATAAQVGVPVFREMPINPKTGERVLAQGCIEGIGARRGEVPVSIHLNPTWGEDEHPLTFGHELGHLFLDSLDVHQDSYNHRDIERFCEYFGRQVAAPKEVIAQFSIEDLPKLVGMFGIRHEALIYQLMVAGKLPRRVYIDTTNGVYPNKFLSNKINRHCVCLDCDCDLPFHQLASTADIPVYDFTAFEWSSRTSNSSCAPNTWMDTKLLREVNMKYDNWTAEDEKHYQEEVECANNIARSAIKDSIDWDDDIPF